MRYLYSFYADAAKIAVQSILAHKLRALLTLIGIIIGVAAVVVVGASISGLNTYANDKVAKVLGGNHFMITRMAHSGQMDDEEFEKRNRRNKKVTWDEYEYVRDNCKLCSEIGAQVNGGADLRHEGIDFPAVRVMGTTANMLIIEDKTIAEGRFFTPDEVQRSSKVCVIGWELKEKLFAYKDPVGQEIKVRGIPVTIVGVEESRGSFFGDNLDRHLYIPITLHNQLYNYSNGIQLHGKSATRENFQPAIEEARMHMRNRRGLVGSEEDTFGVVNVEEINNQIDQITGAIAGVVIPITLITLIVGGIVVMNIMLVSVTERTFEVGLRKALGATKKQILLQFLIESVLLCAIGGLFGLAVASGITKTITVLLEITMTITVGYIILAIGVSSIIGILAGLYPAFKAARLDPIVALTTAK
jgi:putative ABC transport system permease protein